MDQATASKITQRLQKHNILLTDMHGGNVFIHWLNENSYMGNKNINNTKYIYYRHGNQYLKIKTHGLLLKIGDTGTFRINPKSHVYIVGMGSNIKKTYGIAKRSFKIPTCHFYLLNFKRGLPSNIYQKTIAYEILSQ